MSDDSAEVCRQAMVVVIEHVRSIKSLFALRRVSRVMKAICDDVLKRVKSATDVHELWPYQLSLYQFVMEGTRRTCPEMIICWHHFDPEYVEEDVSRHTTKESYDRSDGYPIGTITKCNVPAISRIITDKNTAFYIAKMWGGRAAQLVHRPDAVWGQIFNPDAAEGEQ